MSYPSLSRSILLSLVIACGGAPSTPLEAPSDAGAEEVADGGLGADSSVSDFGESVDSGPSVDAGAQADAGLPSSQFRTIYETIIVPKCGGDNCHLTGTNDSNYYGYSPELRMLDVVTAHENLVNRPTGCQSTIGEGIRVVPLDPGASVLRSANEDVCGSRHHIVVPTLDQSDMAMIESWINSGAL